MCNWFHFHVNTNCFVKITMHWLVSICRLKLLQFWTSVCWLRWSNIWIFCLTLYIGSLWILEERCAADWPWSYCIRGWFEKWTGGNVASFITSFQQKQILYFFGFSWIISFPIQIYEHCFWSINHFSQLDILSPISLPFWFFKSLAL